MKNKLLYSIIAILVLAILITGITTSMRKKEESKKKEENIVEPSNKKEEVTITFDTDGGEKIESMKVEKDSEIELPGTNKEGYTFIGWYDGDKKLETKIKVSKDMTVKAKWEEIKKEAETMKVSFDSNGGSKVSTITMECGKSLTLPKAPTRDGYKFVNWTRNGKVISNGAKLDCKDITLTANWEKNEEPKKEEKKEEPKKEEPKKEAEKVYKCPSGYTLNGTKCSIEGKANTACPEGTKVDGNKCVKTSDYNRGIRTCPVKTVQTTASHTETLEGEYFQQGAGYCGYYVYKSLTTKDACESAYDKNTHWANNKCYAKVIINAYEISCANGYEKYTTDQLAKWNIHDGTLCLRIVDKETTCESGYTLTNGKCIKTIDATLE